MTIEITIEIDENGLGDRNIDYEIKRQKAMQQELVYKFIRIDPDKKNSDIVKTINKIFGRIKQFGHINEIIRIRV